MTCTQCTCAALIADAVGWNCVTSNNTCQLISNYSSNNGYFIGTTSGHFFFQQLPAVSNTTAKTTTSTTSTSSTTSAISITNITYSCGENTLVKLNCTSSMRLTIISAFYGVSSCVGCNCSYCNCQVMNVTSTIVAHCTNLTLCSFTAGNSLFGDPCPDHVKTFILTYFCS